ncbi:MAG: hypothetical protein CMF50_05145 [Legionellales bacterium]|nr:hypothetical protein [Legionellales bacterium]|tara:strand:- start:78265 stop:79266 length:1002 start_codon:yes stop_codon:yes gene_type:complete
MEQQRIMVVEDEAITGMDIKEKLEKIGHTIIGGEAIFSGEEAIEIATQHKPDLIFMDISLQGEIDGIQAATKIREELDIPVVYLTAFADDEILERAKLTTPYGYITKPFTESELYSNSAMALYKHKIESSLKAAHNKLEHTFQGIISMISAMVKAKYPAISTQQYRVATLAVAIANELSLNKDEVESIRIAAMLHCIGLIGIPNEVLLTRANLNKSKAKQYKLYPQIGYDLLSKVEFPWPIADIVWQHRELVDGSGFPRGLKDNEIMEEAKIISVAQFVVERIFIDFDPDVTRAQRVQTALNDLESYSERCFSPYVVCACLHLFNEQGFQMES